MSAFQLKSSLPHATQVEIDRIQAISADRRLASETAFLAALTPYLTNQVILTDENDLIVIASGNTLPTGLTGFQVGALFIDLDSVAMYTNTGSATSATWEDLNSANTIEEGTPVNAVASTGTLTMTGVIVPGVHAESVLTSNATNVTDGKVVVIASTSYRFKNTMAAAYDVKIGASAAATLDNLKAAINATGTPGTEYFAGTLAHPTVVATDNADTTQKIVARTPGTAANTLATTTDEATLSWPAATLGDGTGSSNPGVAPETVTIGGVAYSFVTVLSETNGATAIANQVLFGSNTTEALDNLKVAINLGATIGTNYSTGTVVHPTVTATTNANDSQVVAAKVKGVAGDAITTTSSLANGAWGAATLGSGVNGTVAVANQVLADATYLYHAVAANTIADANWRRVSLGSAY